MNPLRENILSSAIPFLEQISGVLQGLKCEVDTLFLDHICYRTETIKEYKEIKKVFSLYDELLADNQHNGREISVFKLSAPIIWGARQIPVLELLAPKKEMNYDTGFEHVEFVIKEDLRAFVGKHPHLNFNLKNIDKVENPSVKLKLSCGVVKFHEITLEELV